jgi:hypothetical protein
MDWSRLAIDSWDLADIYIIYSLGRFSKETDQEEGEERRGKERKGEERSQEIGSEFPIHMSDQIPIAYHLSMI